jgi:hypothetical protein
MLTSSNNSSNVITASRFDESEVLLMIADGRWSMVDGARWGKRNGSAERGNTTLNTN